MAHTRATPMTRRAGRRRRARGVADGVAAGEAAGDPAQPAHRGTDHGSHGRGEHGTGHGEPADGRHRGQQGHAGRDLGVEVDGVPGGETAEGEERDAERHADQPVVRAVEDGLAHGRHRRRVGGPQGREERRRGGDDEPRGHRQQRPPGNDPQGGVGQLEAEHPDDEPEEPGDADAGDHAQQRGQEPDDHRLGEHRAEDLAARRTDGPQQRQLAGALADDDGEGVVDEERADEQGDQAEGAEQLGEERDELGEEVLPLLGQLGAREDLQRVGHGRSRRFGDRARRRLGWTRRGLRRCGATGTGRSASTARTRAARSLRSVPGSATTLIQSNRPGSPTSLLGLGGVEEDGRRSRVGVESE